MTRHESLLGGFTLTQRYALTSVRFAHPSLRLGPQLSLRPATWRSGPKGRGEIRAVNAQPKFCKVLLCAA